jgi:ankyrin repeat protein
MFGKGIAMDNSDMFLQLCKTAEVCKDPAELESLLTHIRDVNDFDEDGHTPLWHAVMYNEHPKVIETFVSAGSLVTWEMVSLAVIHNQNPKVALSLYRQMPLVSQEDLDRLFLLAAAANTTDQLVRFFLSEGASLDATMAMDLYLDPSEDLLEDTDEDAWELDDQSVQQNALVVAMYENPKPVGMVRTLLELGVNPNAIDAEGYPVLIHALDDPALVNVLLEGNTDANGTDVHGMNALMHACAADVNESALMLIDHTKDVNAVSDTGETALHYALGCHLGDNVTVVSALISAGADVNIPDGDGLLPLEIARFNYCSQQIIDLLVTSGARMGDIS